MSWSTSQSSRKSEEEKRRAVVVDMSPTPVCPWSYLIPVLLHTPLGPLRKRLRCTHVSPCLPLPEMVLLQQAKGPKVASLGQISYLCNLAPAVTGVPHLLQPQLLGRRPRRVGAALFSLWLLRRLSLCRTRRRLRLRRRRRRRRRRRQRRWQCCTACPALCTLRRTRHGFLRLSECH